MYCQYHYRRNAYTLLIRPPNAAALLSDGCSRVLVQLRGSTTGCGRSCRRVAELSSCSFLFLASINPISRVIDPPSNRAQTSARPERACPAPQEFRSNKRAFAKNQQTRGKLPPTQATSRQGTTHRRQPVLLYQQPKAKQTMAEMMMENPAAAGEEGVMGEEEMVRSIL